MDMKEDLKITIEDVTHENAVWLKRHEYYLDGKIVGYSTFRKDDRVYVGAFDDPKDADSADNHKEEKVSKPTPPKAISSQRDALKKRIKELVDVIVMVPLDNGEAYKDWVKQETGYELVEENYTNIIDALEGMSGN